MLTFIGFLIFAIVLITTIFYLHYYHMKTLNEFEKENNKKIQEIIDKVTSHSEKEETNFNNLQTGLINLKDTVTSNESSIDNLSSNITLNAESLEDITDSVQANKTILDTITGSITTNKNNLDNLRRKIDNNAGKLQIILGKIDLLTTLTQSTEQSSDDLLEKILNLTLPSLNRPIFKKLLSPIFYSLLNAIKDHPETLLLSDDIASNVNDNLDVLLKNIDLDEIFSHFKPCMDLLFYDVIGRSMSNEAQTNCMNKFSPDHASFWYSIYKKIHQNIKNDHSKLIFPNYNVVSSILSQGEYKMINIAFKTVKDVLRSIRFITQNEMMEIFTFYPYNLEAFYNIVFAQMMIMIMPNYMSDEYQTPFIPNNFVDNIFAAIPQEASNLEQKHLGYQKGYDDGYNDGLNNLDSNLRVDDSKSEYYKNGYTDGYGEGYSDGNTERQENPPVEEEYDDTYTNLRNLVNNMENTVEGFSSVDSFHRF